MLSDTIDTKQQQQQLHVLFIDSYDSFTYNVVRLIEQQTDISPGVNAVHVTTIHSDTFQSMDQLLPLLPLFDAIVVGPGPGNPNNGAQDMGIISELFENANGKLDEVPILGICLGFQAMCLAQGADISELNTIKHGQVYEMHLNDAARACGLFSGYPDTFKSTRYHSLHVNAEGIDTLLPLCTTEDENGILLMSAQTKNKPWFGVQYHPESCCSELGGLLVSNFLKLSFINNVKTGRWEKKKLNGEFSDILSRLDRTIDRDPIYKVKEKYPKGEDTTYVKQFEVSEDPKLTFEICNIIREEKFVMSSSVISENRGEWSIIALPNSASQVFTHYGAMKKTTVHYWQDSEISYTLLKKCLDGQDSDLPGSLEVIHEDKSQFWITLGKFMENKIIDNHREIPFIGGLVGILGYEIGQYIACGRCNDDENSLVPDAKLVFINNSIVINHKQGKLYCISLDNTFPVALEQSLRDSFVRKKDIKQSLSWPKYLPEEIDFIITMPDKLDYAKAFKKCQDYMHKGDSYEMCLTTQTKVVPSAVIEPWRIFQTLVQRNPAPFSSFFEFKDIIPRQDETPPVLCFLSTSPERFLKWDADTCELRPIKGTVKKGPQMNLAKATRILKTPKEFGENLMILDLIRNDLYELVPDVRVEEFMSVEEYATVYQLVSVVKAHGLTSASKKTRYSGIDVLKHSLPPGSMTGAPKKITVQLLQDKIESKLNKHVNGGARGVYSGVTGYWSVNSNGDWSVNIRCMYSYNGGTSWQLGAGGAITVLSTLDGELEEMYTKLESNLQIFM
ncbi:CDA_G0047140.mRNA.1.CDS.1 [Saccharomyces cerevisiae]|nr:CFA_G0047030.mRNA.1.CDS.1 [Saccharomyces cerevisiae]CAI4765824.1 CDA_G0047140.mRNA.1.CDS.1 [Saccharomyces cerevisiae]CAI7448612.1 CFA_G0047030.mRNA.1.CDS.1 [Saccharomyces cerevisiae]CAI7450006.1 CDA_G0047140.mRNA.1.CDS.1 [Saccharomyces cerevisiae]